MLDYFKIFKKLNPSKISRYTIHYKIQISPILKLMYLFFQVLAPGNAKRFKSSGDFYKAILTYETHTHIHTHHRIYDRMYEHEESKSTCS